MYEDALESLRGDVRNLESEAREYKIQLARLGEYSLHRPMCLLCF
jgi:hypothetical protein